MILQFTIIKQSFNLIFVTALWQKFIFLIILLLSSQSISRQNTNNQEIFIKLLIIELLRSKLNLFMNSRVWTKITFFTCAISNDTIFMLLKI